MADDGDEESNADLKAKMRQALARKDTREKGVHQSAPARGKALGSEVVGGAPKMHRRKAGGGGS